MNEQQEQRQRIEGMRRTNETFFEGTKTMTRHAYVNSTTERFIKWFDDKEEPPQLQEILHWLESVEGYREPLVKLRELCVGLRREDRCRILQWITTVLIYELEDERKFGDTAERFFKAMSERCKD